MEFSLPLLQQVTGRDEEVLLDGLERALLARVLVDRSDAREDRYGFADDQIQHVLYDGISRPRRRRYHLRSGQAIEALDTSRLDDHLEELARHFVEGNDREKGADYSYRAGRKADRLYVWSRSIPLYKTALELWEEMGGHVLERAQVYEQLGDASYKSAIDASGAMGYFEKSLALYEELGDGRKQATLHS